MRVRVVDVWRVRVQEVEVAMAKVLSSKVKHLVLMTMMMMMSGGGEIRIEVIEALKKSRIFFLFLLVVFSAFSVYLCIRVALCWARKSRGEL